MTKKPGGPVQKPEVPRRGVSGGNRGVQRPEGFGQVCGFDEAGRGPLAGPVCAAAVILPEDFPLELLGDSKKLSPPRREEARRVILQRALAWGIGWASAGEIDRVNILRASLLAMERAWEDLSLRSPWVLALGTPDSAAHDLGPPGLGTPDLGTPPGPALAAKVQAARVPPAKAPASPARAAPGPLRAVVDGLYLPKLPIPARALVRADDSVPPVMAASILAKTQRDRLMELYGGLYPEYGYETHKGYPTRAHREALRLHGPSPIQRVSFTVKTGG